MGVTADKVIDALDKHRKFLRGEVARKINLKFAPEVRFRIDEDFHVDATIAGNIARFMNHSCAPNALSRIVDIGSRIHDKRIIIFAARDLQVGEELQYDYQFALGGEKIECHCGAPNCWGRMN